MSLFNRIFTSNMTTFSATDCSLVQRSPTKYDMSLCVIKKPREWGG